MEDIVVLTGTVEDVVYSNEDTGFAVLELDADGEPVTVVGPLCGVASGEELKLTGRYGSHPTYGRQFKAELFVRSLPATAAAILKYLSSGALKGIGPRTAAAIVKKFGDDSLCVIEKEPTRLAEIKGISEKKALAISADYTRIFGIRSVMLKLSGYGLEPSASIRAWKKWGAPAADAVGENPYLLCCEDVGVPFEMADSLALSLGIDPRAPVRLRAGIIHVLSHNILNGHTCLPVDKLVKTSASLLDVPLQLLEDALCGCGENEELVIKRCHGIDYAYLPELYEAESYIAQRIRMWLTPPLPPGRFDEEIDAQERLSGIKYADLQRKAIAAALSNNIFILTGGPGTGKTTTLKAIISILEHSGEKTALAAPTGRAAKRMSELCGREAKTIHRLLEVDYRDGSERIRFKRGEKNLLRAGAVILDEVSMVDTRLLHSLMKALKMSCRLILVGDPDQLPSVGAGNILKDLIDSDMVPTVHLNEIFRQAEQSAIVSNAHLIVRGELPELEVRDSDFFFIRRRDYGDTARTVTELCSERLPKAYGFSPQRDIQIITPSRIGALGTVELNKLLQEKLNPPRLSLSEYTLGGRVIRQGDKIMQIKNNYDVVWKKDDGEEGTGVFNGDIGVVELLDRPSRSMLIRFDDRLAEYSFDMADELEHAWAVTVHKSQGSEFEAVIMPLMAFHPKLYYRNLLYTGVTRARRMLILLGLPETVARIVGNHRKVLRYTNLVNMLTENMPDD